MFRPCPGLPPLPAGPLFTDRRDRPPGPRPFYARVRRHHRLGPMLRRGDRPDGWPAPPGDAEGLLVVGAEHSGRYKGQPMVAHQRIPALTEGLFMPWLNLFHQTCSELRSTPRAPATVGQKAERIAASLKLGLFFKPDAVA
ncbi:group III truncated hemoglobin [Caulobacter segnis]